MLFRSKAIGAPRRRVGDRGEHALTTWNLSGLSAMTWSAWVPMDPVLPRIITCLTIFPIVSLLFWLWFLFVAVWLLLMGGVIIDEA